MTTISDDTFSYAVESSLHVYPQVPGLSEDVGIKECVEKRVARRIAVVVLQRL